MSTGERCETCRFANEFQGGHLECRRYPPQLYSEGDASDIYVSHDWPNMNNDDWCGEYQPKKEPENGK